MKTKWDRVYKISGTVLGTSNCPFDGFINTSISWRRRKRNMG